MDAHRLAPDVHSCHSWVTVVLQEHSAAEFTAAVEISSQANVFRAPLQHSAAQRRHNQCYMTYIITEL